MMGILKNRVLLALFNWYIQITRMINLLLPVYFIVLPGCEEQTSWELQHEPLNTIVVDGLITNERKPQGIFLSRVSSSQNIQGTGITGAMVTIGDEDTTFILQEKPNLPGVYITDSTFQGVVNKQYSLQVEYEGRMYEASSGMLPVTPFERLKLASNEDDSLMYISSVTSEFEIQEPAMYHVHLDWSGVTGYENLHEDSCKALLYYYALPSVDVSQIFAPEREIVYFPPGTIITEKKFSLTREHAEFLRSLLAETTWRGGYFSTDYQNVKTNISSGGLGFFGACTVISETFVAE